jgi:ABC-type branched-subunit amino acid transport system ATPase component
MALLGQPKLLLVDELSLGLAPIVVEQLLGVLRLLRDGGTAIVLVEQSVNVALAIADRAYVMDKGAVVFSGLAEELAARPEVLRSVYLHSKTSGHTRRARAIADAPVALEVVDISIAFGGLVALDRVSIAVPEGHVLGIIGPNGAGKTTLFDIVSGYVRPATGKVILNGRDVTPWSASARARAGLGRSFQDSRLFDDLTVRGALAVALERWIDVGDPMSAMLRTPALALTEAAVERRVDELVELFGLEAHQERLVSELSTGLRRLVDLASITAQSPRVILLDEPSSGIAQREVEELAAVLDRLRARLAATLIVVEHDIAFVRSFADQLVALDQGSVLAAGDPDAVLSNDDVIAAFLGLDPVTRQRSGHADALGAAPSSARRAGDRPSHDGGNRGEDRSTLP